MPDSDAIVRRLLTLSGGKGPADIEVFRDGRGGEPTYWSHPGDPLFTIRCTRDWGRCPLEGKRIRIPAGAVPEGGPRAHRRADNDAHMTIADIRANRVYDLWQAKVSRVPRSGGVLRISWGGVTHLSGSGVQGLGDANAARFSNLAGRVRVEELNAGRINHALFVVVPCDSGRSVFPARKSGTPCANRRDAPPMGARLYLDYSLREIRALPVPKWRKVLLRAMAEYGMFIGDTGSSRMFSVERETGLEYTSLGFRDRWLTFARRHRFRYWRGNGGVYLGDLASAVDWRRLRVLAPCVSRRSC